MVSNSQISPKYGTALAKVKTVASRAAGLSNDGLDSLCKTRVTLGSTASQSIRNQHASLALEMFRKFSIVGCGGQQTVDNLAVQKGGKLCHFTECYTTFEIDDLATQKDSDGNLLNRSISLVPMPHVPSS